MANAIDVLAEALASIMDKKAKKVKTTPKFVLVVNGTVSQQRPTNKDEVKKAVHAILMKMPTAKIELYKFKSELAIALPIAGLEGETEETAEATSQEQGE